MKKFYVYIHLFPNGKRYVGITQQIKIEYRWRKDGSGYKCQEHLYNAIKKYKWNNIGHIVYEVDTPEEMWYLEKYLIAYYNTTNPERGYNHSIGGEKSNLGYKFQEYQKEKLMGRTPWNKDLKMSPEFCEKVSISCNGSHKANSTSFYKGQIPWNKDKKLNFQKQKWLTPDGEIREMCIRHVKQWHPDWTRIE